MTRLDSLAHPVPVWTSDDQRHILYNGDATLITPQVLLGRDIDAICTDPPYNSGGRTTTDRKCSTTQKYKGTSFAGDNRDQRSFAQWAHIWLTQTITHMADGARAWIWTDWRQLPTLTDAIQIAGFTWRQLTPWVKDPGQYRLQKGSAGAQCEYIIWGTKGPQQQLEDQSPALPGFFTGRVPRGDNKRHVAEKPINVLVDLFSLLPANSRIFDPFAGSGTVAAAAAIAGHRSISIELDPQHVENFVSRFAQGTLNV